MPTISPPPDARRRPKLVFVVTEDWFFASHFLPMARVAVAMGLDTAVVTRVRAHAAAIANTGARVVPFEAERRSVNPLAAASATLRLAAILRREAPDIVHCIALKPILIGGAAARLAKVPARVFALTGLGFLGARRNARARAARRFVRGVVRRVLEGPRTRYLFENRDDPRLLGLDPDSDVVHIVGGAGIDPDRLPPTPLPGGDTLRVALVARMLWSKGVDTAVNATRRARARGAAIELSLFGAPDPSNPRAIPRPTLEEWSGRDGVRWHGATADIAGVWRDHHLACLPSRGGEGLPRTLLEAASAGRAILTADVPGCRDFVRNGVEGLIVQPDDPEALADALYRLAADRPALVRMGAAARARVLDGFTEEAVASAVAALYREMLAG